jgi:hypothetical protein
MLPTAVKSPADENVAAKAPAVATDILEVVGAYNPLLKALRAIRGAVLLPDAENSIPFAAMCIAYALLVIVEVVLAGAPSIYRVDVVVTAVALELPKVGLRIEVAVLEAITALGAEEPSV